MWILESTGDFLQGKRMWLKPGKQYLFGRVKKDGVGFAIDHKTVSRKHFVIAVGDVKEGDVVKIHARTTITIIDQQSKSGTYLNGELIKGATTKSKEVKGDEISVRPGQCPEQLIIRWQPCVLTFNLLKKEIKSGVLKIKQDRVKNLDVKVVSDFLSESTTHVVVAKRNTPKGLQALICGKYIVSEAFVDAVEYASTPETLDDESSLSRLESDFDDMWPQAENHLPPPGREPTTRPIESYQPNPSRSTIFENYVFVFGDQLQYDNLLPVITTGHGKALMFPVINGQTTVDEAVDFMHTASGNKSGKPKNSPDVGGAVMVRWTAKNEFEEWTSNLINQTASKLDQRAIDQAEFLDAVLANDAGLLRQPVPFDNTNEGRVAPPPSIAASSASIRPVHGATSNTMISPLANGGGQNRALAIKNIEDPVAQQGQESISASSTPIQHEDTSRQEAQASQTSTQLRKQARFHITQLSVKVDFDDGFDPDAIAAFEDEEDDGEAENTKEEEENETSQMDYDTNLRSQHIDDASASNSRKRPFSQRAERAQSTFDEDMDDLLPAATAMKRRKTALEIEASRNGYTIAENNSKKPAEALSRKPRRKEKEINVIEFAKARREKEHEAARKEREDVAEALQPDDMENTAPANLVVVMQLDLPLRQNKPPATRQNPEHDPRWDPRWNGKKNFKRFTPQGHSTGRQTRHATKVIVPLVEVKGNTNGLGDKYWEKTPEEKERERRRKEKEKGQQQRSQSQSQSTSNRTQTLRQSGEATSDQDSDVEEVDRPHTNDVEPSLLEQEAAAFLGNGEIDMDSPRRTRASDSNGTHALTQTQTQTQAKGTQAIKRSAPSSSAASASRKRQKTLPVKTVTLSDDDDSDDMKFRFGSRKGKAKAKT